MPPHEAHSVIYGVNVTYAEKVIYACGHPSRRIRARARMLLSDCVACQAYRHGVLSLIIALMMTRSLRATAMSATIFGFPAARSRR